MKIGLITNKDYPGLYPDDQLLHKFLKEKGHHIYALIWDDPSINWQMYDLLIIRSVWDYHLFPKEFKIWLDRISNLKIRTLNSPTIVKGNMHKSYLLDLEKAGLNIIKTILFQKGIPFDLSSLPDLLDAESFIIKPAVSLSAYNTHHISRNKVSGFQHVFNSMIGKEDVLIQPYIPEITTTGELSFIFINRKFSHVIKKLPAKNDFRVQSEFGGVQKIFKAPEKLVDQARKFIDEVEGELLYARVDGIVIQDIFTLMELELIDPVLHFNLYPESLEMFSSGIEQLYY